MKEKATPSANQAIRMSRISIPEKTFACLVVGKGVEVGGFCQVKVVVGGAVTVLFWDRSPRHWCASGSLWSAQNAPPQ